MHITAALSLLLAADVEPAVDAEQRAGLDSIAPEAPATEGEVTPAPPADSEATAAPRETVVRATRPRTAASASTVRNRDFVLRPHTRPADILSTVPGFYVAQHAGGGKANQYFLRGFDADHGTDVLLTVDGVPANMVSHGHGQGYADLNFVIPELIEKIEVKKGPYFADVGDFGTAGAVDMVMRKSLARSSVSASTAAFATDDFTSSPLRMARVLALTQPDIGAVSPILAAEVLANDGPFENGERLRRFNLVARLPVSLGDAGNLLVTGASYGSGWNASGQLPMREVKSGRLSRFGALDASDGGASQRHALVARFDNAKEDESFMVQAYLLHSRLSLYSNFTFFSADDVRGDQIEQTDLRTVAGAHARYAFHHHIAGPFGAWSARTAVGLQTRNDLVETGLHTTQKRARLDDVVDAGVAQGQIGAYVEEELALPPYVRFVLGVRGDGFGFSVEDHLGGEGTSGTRFSTVVSPKGSAIVTVPEIVHLYANAGMGFHSNDARGVVRNVDPVDPITRGTGGELGARTRLLDAIDVAADVFALHLQQETVWIGDAGTTELRGQTLRTGVEVEGRARLYFPWLYADADVTLTRARFLDLPEGADHVPLAPGVLATAGISVYDLAGFFGRLGVTALGDRPATEDAFITTRGFVRVDGSIGWKSERMELSLDVQNLFNTPWEEAQFANVSRLPRETAAGACVGGTRAASNDDGTFAGCEDLHFTPGTPLQARANVTFFF